MIKYQIFAFCMLITFGCRYQKKENSIESNTKTAPTKINSVEVSEDNDQLIQPQIETWYSVAYMDSSIAQKTIHKYSWSCASYAYKIRFDRSRMDSIEFIGYHELWKDELFKTGDNEYRMGNNNQYWELRFLDEHMTLQEFYKDHDTTKYIFEKKDIEYSTLEEYFSNEIIVGTYLDTENGNKIKLNSDFTVLGIDSIKEYEILIDFWEMVPQMDVIYLKDTNGRFNQYNWDFNNDLLYLREVKNAYETDTGWVAAKIVGDTIIWRKTE